ncbi:MAG: DUF4382 domain-containing protein [Nitrospirota bacterium]
MKQHHPPFGARVLGMVFGLFALAGLSACSGSGAGNEPAAGTVTLAMTDAPADELDALTVTIESAALIGDDGPIDLPLPDGEPITVNILDLDGINQILATAAVPAGRYTKVRLGIRDASVTWPDGTVQDVTIVANGHVDLNFQGHVDVVDGGSLTIQLDFSAEDSLKLTETGNGRLILRPQIFVSTGLNADDPDNPLVDDVRGVVASVDADARTFELRTVAGSRIVIVVTDETAFVSHHGEAAFSDLHAGLLVHVEGTLQADGRLAAEMVHLVRQRYADVGVIANLDATAGTFHLVHVHRDPIAVQYTNDTRVRFRGQTLTTADLANGQLVRVGGDRDESGVLQAKVIRIRGDRFAGVVTDIAACATDDTLSVKIGPRRLLARLALAGVTLPNDTITVHTQHDLPCPLLIHAGSLVRVWGRLAPDASAPGGVTFLAARVVVLPGHALVGLVTDVESDPSDPSVGSFLLRVGTANGLVSTPHGVLVEAVLRVRVTTTTVFAPDLSFGPELVGQRIGVLGRFIRTDRGIEYAAVYVKSAE